MTSKLSSPFLDQVRSAIRVRHYSIRTEQAYVSWIKQFILFHGKKHPTKMGDTEVNQFLSYLAEQRNVASATQNQALNALVFVYRHVLDKSLGELQGVIRAKKPERLPVVLSRQEVGALLALLYGSGLRLMEATRLKNQ